MKSALQISIFTFFFLMAYPKASAQEMAKSDPDIDLKLELYNKYKKEVLAFTKKDFDALFFEFFTKMDEGQPLMTKEEYYTYTIKIAIYNERLGRLYKDKKEISSESKEKWFGKDYQVYLNSK